MSKSLSIDPDPINPDPINRAVLAHRMVQAGLLMALTWKWTYFSASAQVYLAIPLQDDFFPSLLQSPWVLIGTYLATVGAIALNLVTASRPLQLTCSWVTIIGTTILCLHQGSYNDMTFVTAWWTSVWSVWYVYRLNESDQPALLRRGALLSRLIISVILLGGAAGKWTGEYWSGDVFYDIYFRDRDFWVFNLLRENFETDALHEIARWYSRKVTIVETLAGFGLWMLPPRWAASIAVVLLSSIALFSNILLFSVLMSLIGLAAVGLLVAKTDVRP